MSWSYSLLFDYPLLPLVIGLLIIIGVWFYVWIYGNSYFTYVVRHFTLIGMAIFMMLAGALYSAKLGDNVMIDPIQTHYYLATYQGKDEWVAFCFKRFETQQNMGYADFMQKCFADDWERHRYNNLPK